jgi:TetR/AcrR family transcriptional regulator, regulator of cefoperazone and chloramphenicol sensitivity
MKTSLKQRLEADGPNLQTVVALPPRDRVLEVACELFAEAGFHGTHIREICKRAGTNVAGICYHFESKEGLYQAVMMEAGRRLSAHQENFVASKHLPPEQRVVALIESLLERLKAKRAWIAKLLVRELLEPACGAHTYVASGLGSDFVLLQSALRESLGTDTQCETTRLHALSLISECVFYSLTGEDKEHPLLQLAAPLPGAARLARFLLQRFLRSNQSETLNANLS